MKLKLIVLLQFILVTGLYAQKTDKNTILNLLSESKKVYESNNGVVQNVIYKLYPTYTASSATEEYKGVIATKGKKAYAQIGFAEFVNLDGHFLHIDNQSKLIQYSSASEKEISVFDFFKFINNFTNYSIKTEGNTIVCTLSSGAVTFVPYSKIEIHLDKNTKQIIKQKLYLLISNNYKDSKGNIKSGSPRMEITFSSTQKTSLPGYDKKFILGTYLLQSDKNKFSVASDYTGYTIIDSKN